MQCDGGKHDRQAEFEHVGVEVRHDEVVQKLTWRERLMGRVKQQTKDKAITR